MKPKWPDNLTLEDFKRLAAREPDTTGPYMYRLVQYMLAQPRSECQYPRFYVYEYNETFFLSLAEAEEKIRYYLTRDDADETYCFRVERLSSGDETHWFGVFWLYDAQGKLLDYTTTRWDLPKKEGEPFYGRPAERQRFKRGDIVEVMVPCEEVHLALYLHGPDTPEQCYESYLQFGHHSTADDDVAYLLVGSHRLRIHEGAETVRIMKPRWPIPADIEAEMKSWLVKEYPDEAYFDHPRREVTHHGVGVNQFGQMDIRVHYDENAPVPHLHIDDGYGFHTCLRIDRPEYFVEDGAQPALLSESQKEALMDFFELLDYAHTGWWYFLRDYNADHQTPANYHLPLDLPIPDYRKL